MIHIERKQKLFILWGVTALFLGFSLTSYAGSSHSAAGFAWSDNTGWISFNSTNCDPDGNGFSDSGISGCPTGGSTHWEEVNDIVADDETTMVHTSSASYQKDSYALEDTAQTGTINEVNIFGRMQGCAEFGLIVEGVEYGADGSGVVCGSGFWQQTGGYTVSTFDVPGGLTWDKINDMEAIARLSNYSGSDGRITQVWVEVTYNSTETLVLRPNGSGTLNEIEAPSGGASAAVSDYGVNIDGSGDFSGYAWSSNVGWVWFGATTTCPAGTCQANVSIDNVSGWAKILSLGDSDGWISLECENTTTCGTSDYGVTFNQLTGEFGGWAWSSTLGWVSFNALNCDADEDGLSDGGAGCPAAGAAMSDYAVTYLDGVQLPPSAPIVTGPVEGVLDESYEFGFVAHDNNAGVEVFTITDDVDADTVGDITLSSFTEVSDIYVDGNYLYVTGYMDDSLNIFDITDPKAVSLELTVLDNNSPEAGTGEDLAVTCMNGPTSVYVSGGKAYVTSEMDSCVTIFDVSNVSSGLISEDVHIQDSIDSGVGVFRGFWGIADVVTQGGYMYIASEEDNTILVFDIATDPLNPSLEYTILDDDTDPAVASDPVTPDTTVNTIDGVDDLAISEDGNYLFAIASVDSAVSIFDISTTPDAPSLVYTIVDDESPETGSMTVDAIEDTEDISISNGVAYVLGWDDDAVVILDITTPTSPTLLSTIVDDESPETGDVTTTGIDGAEDVFVLGEYLYVVANNDAALSIFNISTPKQPVHIRTTVDDESSESGDLNTEVLEGAEGLFVSGDYVYAGGFDDSSLGVYTAGTPEGTLHYGVDWDHDNNVDVWVPGPSTLVNSGDQASTTYTWTVLPTGPFQACAVDSSGATSSWKEHTINIITNGKPNATIQLPAAGNTYPSPVTLSAAFSDDSGETFYAYKWYWGSPNTSCETTPTSPTLTGRVPDDWTFTSDSQAIAPDGSYEICLMVADSHVGNANQWSDCECVNINVGTECNDDNDNDGDVFFDDGVVGEGTGENLLMADPACYDTGGVYHPEYNDESNDPECSDGIDNDEDGLFDDGGGDPDLADPACYSDFDVTGGVYNRFGASENNCGVVNPGTGEVSCDAGETFGNCPSDCSSEFQFIEF